MTEYEEQLFDDSFLRQIERLALIFRSAANSQMSGERRSKRRGQSVEFTDFRPYSSGDDFRRIDWNAYARLERLFIKLFVEEEEIVLHLLIDNSLSMGWGEPEKLHYAKRAAGALGYIALVGLDRVSASSLFPQNRLSPYFPPVHGKSSALRLFSYLKSISASAGSPKQGGIASSYSLIERQPGAVMIFSDLMDDSWQPYINQLRGQGHEISIIHVLSQDEYSPQIQGEFRLVDSETSAEVEITADFATLQRYHSQLEAWQHSWNRFCATRGIAYIPISTDLPLRELLFVELPRQMVLK